MQMLLFISVLFEQFNKLMQPGLWLREVELQRKINMLAVLGSKSETDETFATLNLNLKWNFLFSWHGCWHLAAVRPVWLSPDTGAKLPIQHFLYLLAHFSLPWSCLIPRPKIFFLPCEPLILQATEKMGWWTSPCERARWKDTNILYQAKVNDKL